MTDGAEVGVIVTDGVIEMFEEFLPCKRGVREPDIKVAPPGKDWRGNGNIDVDGSNEVCLEKKKFLLVASLNLGKFFSFYLVIVVLFLL